MMDALKEHKGLRTMEATDAAVVKQIFSIFDGHRCHFRKGKIYRLNAHPLQS